MGTIKRKLIFWGIGTQFNNIINGIQSIDLSCSVMYVIDKDEEKNGKFVYINNKKYVVDAPDLLNSLDPYEYSIVVSTTKYYDEVCDYISEYYCAWKGSLISIDYIWELETDARILGVAKCPKDYRKNIDEKIPRIIHTFWFSNDKIPDLYMKCLDSWRKYCPDFEIRIWSLNDYDDNGCDYFREAINAKKWSFASDYSRAEVVYKYGGIYMDMDVEVVRNIDDLLHNDAYMSFQDLNYLECGSGFGASKGNTIIGEIVREYERLHFIKENGDEDLTTCPQRYTKIVEPYGLKKNGAFQEFSNLTIYPFEYLTAKSFGTGITYLTENTYTVHHHNGSWVTKENKLKWNRKYEWIRKYYSCEDKR